MKKRLMIVDDSVVFRSAISQALSDVPQIEVVRTAANGQIALDYLKSDNIDLIVLDLEMPVLDGMATIQEIRKTNKDIKIIVFSGVTEQAAGKTIEALTHGANDFVSKVEGSSNIDESILMIKEELAPKVIALLFAQGDQDGDEVVIEFTRPDNPPTGKPIARPNIVLIGSSTGGPEALMNVIPKISGKCSVPILIVQHMPPFFTAQLAKALDNASELTVVEAQGGERLEKGHVYIAKGDYHLELLSKDGDVVTGLNQGAKVCFVRPAVDVLFNSVSHIPSLKPLSFVLTGMGEDGKMGSRKLYQKGHQIVVQNEATSLVYGMPKAVFEDNVYSRDYTLEQIVSLINDVTT